MNVRNSPFEREGRDLLYFLRRDYFPSFKKMPFCANVAVGSHATWPVEGAGTQFEKSWEQWYKSLFYHSLNDTIYA